MNQSTSKKILFNKSSLFNLKAELLKKQEEVHEKKQLPQHKLDNFKPAPSKPNNSGIDVESSNKKSFKDSLKAVDAEELAASRKVSPLYLYQQTLRELYQEEIDTKSTPEHIRSALEKKAELYDHLQDSIGDSQLASRFLVDFNTKKQQESIQNEKEEIYEHANQEDDSEWTEFTDCLGRTRKCLKSDLDVYQKRDKDLLNIRNQNKDGPEPVQEEPSQPKSEKPFLVQKTNDYLQTLRDKWEKKEQELLGKDQDIHYQDLLFDEARMHGVGYYAFSTDEDERRKQLEELALRRRDTLAAQRAAGEARRARDGALAARVAAARARQRARAGLPPEQPSEENEKDFTTHLLEFLTQQKNEADAKAKEKEQKEKEEKEKERQKLREAYVREWDMGKEGIDEKAKKFREMTQEEYVEQQRSKRIDEFAPPQSSSKGNTQRTFDDSGKTVEPAYSDPTPKTWSEVRPRVPTPPPPPYIGETTLDGEQKGLYFSSSKKTTTPHMKYKNFVKPQEPIPIENELSDEDPSQVEKPRPEKRKHEPSQTEIAPPPTYDYYGPTPKHTRPQKPFDSDIREAYAQGAKSLESRGKDRQLSKQYDFTFD